MIASRHDGASNARRVLIYRLGSVGDTLVALPTLRLVGRAFPGAEFGILTTRSANPNTSMAALLKHSGLAGTVIDYQQDERDPRALCALARRIRAFAPDVLVYLAEPRGLARTWRDWFFFQFCGIRRIVGAPLTPNRLRHRFDPTTGLWEPAAVRLARNLAVLGDARLDDPNSWAPDLSSVEEEEGRRALDGWDGAENFIAACVNVRTPARDWGEDNWAALFKRLGRRNPALGLLLVGGPMDEERSNRLAACWPGPCLVQCRLPPAAAMAAQRGARMFIGVDSGPMHMAAAVGVPTVTLFAGIHPYGIWFPSPGRHTVLHHRTPCMGCGLAVCATQANACLTGIGVDRMFDACMAMLEPTA